jgi:GTP cyclohydrolase I
VGKPNPVAKDLSVAYAGADDFRRESVLRNMAEALVRQMLLMIEPDQKGYLREGLQETPKRVIKSWMEIFGGYAKSPEEILGTTFKQEGYKYDEMVLCKDIELYSTCEHHMLPFYGKAHVAYVPSERVVGLSKLARLVDCFSRRLQIQEKLTSQIADSINEILEPKGVAVVIEAKHHCMCSRGVGKQNSAMVTSALRGIFKEDLNARNEFLNLIR